MGANEYEYSADGVTFTATAPSAQINVKRDVNGNTAAYVTYVRMSHKNYETKTVTESLTITPAPITVTPNGATYPYAIDADGQPIVRTVDTASTNGKLYKGANVVPTFRDNTRSAMGSQSVYINTVRVWIGTNDVTANYAITTDTATLAIIRGTDAVSIDAQGGSTVYDANSHAINAPRVLVQATDGAMVDRKADFAVTYDVTYTDRDGNTTTTADLTKLDFVNAGSYAVTVKATSDQYAAPSSVTVTYIINARTLTVTSEDNSAAPYTFNGKEQTVKGDFTVDNLVEKQTLANLSYADGLSNANTDAVDRGVLLNGLTVMAGRTDVTANYQINYVAGRIVIGALPIPAASIVIDDVNVVYDGNTHSITLPQTIRTSAGTISVADEFDVEYSVHGVTTTTVPTSVDFGSTDVTVHLISRSGNYAPEDVTANVTVTARTLTIAYGTLTAPYDATAHTVDRTISGLVDRDAIAVTDVNRSAIGATRNADGDFGAITATASDYAITDANDAAIDRSANYTVTVTDGSLNVTPIAISVTAGTNSYVYNGAEQSVTDYTVRGSTVKGQTLEATLGGNTATNVVTRQPVSVTLVTITDANGVDVTDNYRLTAVNGSLTITQAPLTLGVTTLSVVYDGAPHTPEGYVVGGLQKGDSLAAYQLKGMPKTEAGAYSRVSYVRSATVLRSKAGADVTANYKITYQTGALTITQPTTTYSVEYYYDGVIGATVTLNGRRGDVVTTYPTRAVDGYTFDRATGAPMTLSEAAADNVIRVYYIAVATPNLFTFTDAEIPLAGNMASLNVGAALE